MVIKILKGSQNFAGVNYNHEKVEQGKAELLGLYNMNFPDQNYKTSNELKSYLKVFSSNNKKVKKPQFHATISAKGKSKSKTELQAYAEKYMEHMGYGEQPYLIYFHGDTDNNHIHIVSTRINDSGKYINDSFEKLRSNEYRDRTLEIHQESALEQVVNNALLYSYTSDKQAELYFERLGYITSVKDDTLSIIKSGKKRGSILKSDLKIIAPDRTATKKLYELFKKYSNGLEVAAFKNIMHNNFGIEIMFHHGKDKKIPYGYTVFDHQNFKAYKGSEIIPLTAILKGKDRASKIKSLDLILNVHLNDSISFSMLKNELKQNDFSLSNSGKIYLKETNEELLQLSKTDLQELYHYERMDKFNAAVITSIDSLEALRSIYKQKPEAIWKGNLDSNIPIEMYREKILTHADYGSSYLNKLFKDEAWQVHNFKGKDYILDTKLNVLLSKVDDLNLNLSLGTAINPSQVPIASQSTTPTKNYSIPDIFNQEPINEFEENARKKKKSSGKKLTVNQKRNLQR